MLLQVSCAGPLTCGTFELHRNKSLTVFPEMWWGGGVVWGFREGQCDVSSGLSQPGGKSC